MMQKGLAPIIIVLILAGSLALTIGAYYLVRQNLVFPKSDTDYFIKDEESLKNRVKTEMPSPTPAEDFINNWLTFSSDKYTFKYPPALNAYKTEKDYARVLFDLDTPDQKAQFSVDSRLLSDYANYDKGIIAARKRFINPLIETIDGGTKISSSFDVGTGREVHTIVVLLKYQQGAVALEYTGNSKNIPTFNKILSTFKFINQINETANWKTYTNTKAGYSFKYPDNIKLTAVSTPNIELTTINIEGINAIDFEVSNTKFRDLKEYLAGETGVKVKSSKDLEIGRVKLIQRQVIVSGVGGEVEQEVIHAIYSGKLLKVISDNLPKTLDILNKIISTFKFLE